PARIGRADTRERLQPSTRARQVRATPAAIPRERRTLSAIVHQTCEILIVPAAGGASRTLVRTAFTCELLSSGSLDPGYRFSIPGRAKPDAIQLGSTMG